MAAWQFELEAMPTRDAVIEGAPAIYLPEEKRDISLALTAEERRHLTSSLDALLPGHPAWSSGLEIWGNTRGTDVQLFDDDDSTTLKVRIDARHIDQGLIEALCAIAADFGWVFVTERGAVLQPIGEIVLRSVISSPSRAFVENSHSIVLFRLSN